MSVNNPPPAQIAKILREAKRIAVVGLSSKPERASYWVGKLLLEKGYDIIPINPKEREIFGKTAYGSLSETAGDIDIVDVFRRSDQTDPIIDEAIAIKADVVWLQEGVINERGAERARAAGLTVLQDICIAKELRKL